MTFSSSLTLIAFVAEALEKVSRTELSLEHRENVQFLGFQAHFLLQPTDNKPTSGRFVSDVFSTVLVENALLGRKTREFERA